MGIEVDLTGAGTIPAGTYVAIVQDHTVKESKSSPYDYAALELVIQEGEYAGYKLRTNLSFSPDAAFKMKEYLIAQGKYTEGMRKYDLNIEDDYGRRIQVEVDDEVYNEQTRSAVQHFLPIDAAPSERAASAGNGRRRRGE